MKKDRWAATKDAHVAYEKLLSKFLKEKKAAYKSTQAKEKVEEKKAAPAKPVAKPETKKEAPKAAPAKAEKKTKATKKWIWILPNLSSIQPRPFVS